MKPALSRVTAQGQASVPAEVRRRLGLGPGAMLAWEVDGDCAVVRRVGRYLSEDVHGVLFPSAPRPRRLAELKEGVRRRARSKHARR